MSRHHRRPVGAAATVDLRALSSPPTNNAESKQLMNPLSPPVDVERKLPALPPNTPSLPGDVESTSPTPTTKAISSSLLEPSIRRAAFTISLLFISSLAMSLGHHFFNASLSQRPPSDIVIHAIGHSFTLTGQGWAINIGNIFAYLSKTLLLAAVVGAYSQILWLVLQRRAMSVGGIDAGFAILDDPVEFRKLELWKRAGILVGLAAIAWAVPIPSVFTPSTLTVVPTPVLNKFSCIVPTIDLSTDHGYALGELTRFELWRPSAYMTVLAMRTVANQNILSLPNPCELSAHCSYPLKLLGPVLTCTPDADSVVYRDDASFTFWNGTLARDEIQDTVLFGWRDTAQHGVRCLAYVGAYDVVIEHADASQRIVVLNATTTSPLATYTFGTGDALSPLSAQSVSILLAFTERLTGSMNFNHGGLYNDNLAFVSSLASWSGESPVFFDEKRVATMLTELLANITIGLISLSLSNTSTTCTDIASENRYSYQRGQLLGAYAGALLLALPVLLMGLHALRRNKREMDLSFSRVMVTTRNPRLDELLHGSPRAKGEKALEGVRLRYGARHGAGGQLVFGVCED